MSYFVVLTPNLVRHVETNRISPITAVYKTTGCFTNWTSRSQL